MICPLLKRRLDLDFEFELQKIKWTNKNKTLKKTLIELLIWFL